MHIKIFVEKKRNMKANKKQQAVAKDVNTPLTRHLKTTLQIK
jgi:hypothetical protein